MDTSEKKFSKKDMFISKDAQFSAPPCVKFLTVFVGNFLSYSQKTVFSSSFRSRGTRKPQHGFLGVILNLRTLNVAERMADV